MSDSAGAKIFTPILIVWLVGSGFASLYYNWEYAKEHGFWAWLMFGEVIATIKGLLWPIMLFLD